MDGNQIEKGLRKTSVAGEQVSESKTVQIAYETQFVYLDIDEWQNFQGEGDESLKDLSKENYEKLKNEILTTGFAFPPHVWNDPEDKLWKIIDAHQRKRTLTRMREEGYTIPKVPCVQVHAGSYEEAKIRVLQGTTQYGKVSQQGAYAFIVQNKIEPDFLVTRFNMPNFEFKPWKVNFFGEPGETTEVKFDVKENLIKIFEVVVMCGDEASQQAAYEKLIDEGYQCRVLSM